jgi:membrane protein DedA with SNARE-associated domain
MSGALVTHLIATYGYAAVFALIALESLGIPLPGETALIAAALYAGSTHRLNIVAIGAVAVAAAIIGDNAGYWLGRRGGGALVARYGHLVRLDRKKLKVGRYLFARHGFTVVFLGRFVSVLRTYAAFLAGVSRMPLRGFAVANAAGALLWAGAYAAAAYGLGNAAGALGPSATIVGLALTTVLTVTGVLLLRRRMSGLEERAEAMFPEPVPQPPPAQQQEPGLLEQGPEVLVGRCVRSP